LTGRRRHGISRGRALEALRNLLTLAHPIAAPSMILPGYEQMIMVAARQGAGVEASLPNMDFSANSLPSW
jgi:hypothetical protein